MTQLGLMEWTPPRPAPEATVQAQELARVEGRLGEFILGWCKARLDGGEPRFHLAELAEDVECQVEGAPDSPSRILRLLRQRGQVAYRVVSRRASLYEIEAVR